MPCRNEEWCLGLTLQAILQWVDTVVVLDHASTDHSREIIQEIQNENRNRVVFLTDDDPTWHEMAHRQRMLEEARKQGATHIALIDADEILTSNLVSSAHRRITSVCADITVEFPWLCLSKSTDRVYAAGTWGGSFVSTAFCDFPHLHWSSTERNGYDFHRRHPLGRDTGPLRFFADRSAGVMHLQFVNDRRLRAKQYLYQLTERLRWPNREPIPETRKRYTFTVEQSESIQTKQVPADWWNGYENLMQFLQVDAEPWQLLECHRLLKENPGLGTGLNDFGVMEDL